MNRIKINITVSSSTVFSIDNNTKCFFEKQIIMISDHVTLKTGVMMLIIKLCITGINYFLI